MSLLISFVILVLVVAILFWLLKWALPKMGVGGQALNIIIVIFVIIAVLAFLGMLLGYVPRPF